MSWPATNRHVGRYRQRRPPYRLYLVAVNPVVLVGAADATLPAGDHLGVFSNYVNTIPVATGFPAGDGASLTVLYPKGGVLAADDIPLSDLPATIALSGRDSIMLTMDGNWIVTTRVQPAEDNR